MKHYNRSLGTTLRILSLLLGLVCQFPRLVWGQSSANPGVVEVDEPGRYSQMLVLSDVHGMFDHLTTLLRAARVVDAANQWTAGKSLLIICGDSIDKGPNSLGVLRLWMRLARQAQASGGRVIVLLGNHEAEFLNDPTIKKSALFREELTGAKLLPAEVASGKDTEGIGAFLRSLPLAARIGKYLVAHAGWYPRQMPWTEFVQKARTLLAAGIYSDALITGGHSILEEKDEIAPDGVSAVRWYDDSASVKSLEARLAEQRLYGVIFGHQPHAFGFKGCIGGVDGLHIIKIDTGMAPDGDDSAGEILCFRHPSDLTRLAAPDAERLLADGTHAPLEIKKIE